MTREFRAPMHRIAKREKTKGWFQTVVQEEDHLQFSRHGCEDNRLRFICNKTTRCRDYALVNITHCGFGRHR